MTVLCGRTGPPFLRGPKGATPNPCGETGAPFRRQGRPRRQNAAWHAAEVVQGFARKGANQAWPEAAAPAAGPSRPLTLAQARARLLAQWVQGSCAKPIGAKPQARITVAKQAGKQSLLAQRNAARPAEVLGHYLTSRASSAKPALRSAACPTQGSQKPCSANGANTRGQRNQEGTSCCCSANAARAGRLEACEAGIRRPLAKARSSRKRCAHRGAC